MDNEQVIAIVDPFTDEAFKMGHDAHTIITDTPEISLALLSSNFPFTEVPAELNVQTAEDFPVDIRLNTDGTRDVYYPYQIFGTLSNLAENTTYKISYLPTGYLSRDLFVKYVPPPLDRWNALLYLNLECGFDRADNAEIGTEAENLDHVLPGLTFARLSTEGLFNYYMTEPEVYVQSSYSDYGPIGTRWAHEGLHGNPTDETFCLENVGNLFFVPWELSFGNENATAQLDRRAIVWHLPTNSYFYLKVTRWQSGGGGGFAYDRSCTDVTPTRVFKERYVPPGWNWFNKADGVSFETPEGRDIVRPGELTITRGNRHTIWNYDSPLVDSDQWSDGPDGTEWAFPGLRSENDAIAEEDFIATNQDITYFQFAKACDYYIPKCVGLKGLMKWTATEEVYEVVVCSWTNGNEVPDEVDVGFEYMWHLAFTPIPPAWYNLVDMRIWGSDNVNPNMWGRMWYYGSPGGTNVTRDISSLQDPGNDGTLSSYYFNSYSFSDPGEPASAWWGKTQDSTYGVLFDRKKSWAPTKIKATWEPPEVGIQIYMWDDYFTELVDYNTVQVGGSVELDVTYTIPDQYHRGYVDYMGVDSAYYVSGNTGPHVPFKLLSFEAWGKNPDQYWRVVQAPPAPIWHDITDPSFWVSPLGSNVTWTGTEWSIYTDGMTTGSPSYLRATPETKANYFMTGTQIRLTGDSPNKVTLYYETIYSVQTDSLYYADIPHPLVGVARAIPAPIMNAKADWIGFSPADRYSGGTSTITKIEILAPPLV